MLTEIQNRGVKDILIARADGLKGFPDAINSAFPETQTHLCVVHRVRNSLKYVGWKDYKAVTSDLKQIYTSATEEDTLLALDRFAKRWDEKYPLISKTWRNHWQNLNTLFNYPEDIRKATKRRKLFPTGNSAKKVIYLAVQAASKKWTMPIRNWKLADTKEYLQGPGSVNFNLRRQLA